MLAQKLDGFRIDHHPNYRTQRIVRLYPNSANKKQCWILRKEEVERLFRTLGEIVSKDVREEVAGQ
jgi:hypothetical protein